MDKSIFITIINKKTNKFEGFLNYKEFLRSRKKLKENYKFYNKPFKA